MLDHREEKFHERLGRCYIEIEKFSKQYEGKFKTVDRKLEIEVSISTFFTSCILSFSEFLIFNKIEREKYVRVQNERRKAL